MCVWVREIEGDIVKTETELMTQNVVTHMTERGEKDRCSIIKHFSMKKRDINSIKRALAALLSFIHSIAIV